MNLDDIAEGRVVVLGIGNPLKGDDGAGPLLAGLLRERYPEVVFDGGSAPENLVGPVRRARPDSVLLVDAADFGGRPGEIRVTSAGGAVGGLPGTHAVPLGMFAKALAEELGASVHLIAVQAGTTHLGNPMSPAVAASVERLALEIGKILARRESP